MCRLQAAQEGRTFAEEGLSRGGLAGMDAGWRARIRDDYALSMNCKEILNG